MKLVNENLDQAVSLKFGDLVSGDVFTYANERNIYMKVGTFGDIVRLRDGSLYHGTASYREVKRINGEFRYEL